MSQSSGIPCEFLPPDPYLLVSNGKRYRAVVVRHFGGRYLQRILGKPSTAMIHAAALLLTLAFAGLVDFAEPADAPDIQELQQKIELLEAKLQRAEKENE